MDYVKFIRLLLILLYIGWLENQQTNAIKHHHHHENIKQQKFLLEPQDQVAVVGSRVTLACRVINLAGSLQWTKDDFGLGFERALYGFERYTMIGSDEEGDYTLEISPVMLDDDAIYQCQVGSNVPGVNGIRSRYATLNVLVPPDPPKILQGSHLATTEDLDIEIKCTSQGGKPAPEITWLDISGHVITTGIETMRTIMPDMKRYITSSVLRFKTRKEHHGKIITCQTQNSAEKFHQSAQISLEVHFAPKVQIIIQSRLENGYIRANSDAIFYCDAQGNPGEITYRWFINDMEQSNSTDKYFKLVNVTKEQNNYVIKCEATNAIGISSDSEILEVCYPPKIRHQPESVEADVGQTFTLYCDVDSNPPTEIIWVYDPIDRINFQPRVVGNTKNLTLTANNETEGRYFCKANLFDYPEVKAESYVYIKKAPQILSFRKSSAITNRYFDKQISFECIASSIPKARHLGWSRDGQIIENSEIYSIRDEFIMNGIKSILIIEDKMDNFGVYGCTVINTHGSVTEKIIYQEKENQFLIYILISGVSGLLFCIICISICCCKLNTTKKPQPADIIPKHDAKCTKKKGKEKMLKTLEHNGSEEKINQTELDSYSTTLTISSHTNTTVNPIQNSVYLAGNTIDLRYSTVLDPGETNVGSCQTAIGSTSYVNYAGDYYNPLTNQFGYNNVNTTNSIRNGSAYL